jgi:predicted ATP-dependent serine protease
MSGQFVGRAKQLEDMNKLLENRTGTSRRQILVLQGLGGIGKTQLAIEYAVQNQQTYTAVLWANGKTVSALRLSLAQMAEQISLLHVLDPIGKLKKGEVGLDEAIDAVTAWFEAKTNTKWLLIIDNVDSQTTAVVGSKEGRDDSYDVRKYIPSTSHGHILITTRLSRMRRLGFGLEVNELDEDEGLAVLCHASGRSPNEKG